MDPPRSSVIYQSQDYTPPTNAELERQLFEHYLSLSNHHGQATHHRPSIVVNHNKLSHLSSIESAFAHKFVSNENMFQDYLKTHKIWYPNITVEDLLTKKYKVPRKKTRIKDQQEGFVPYIHVPSIISDIPPPSLVYHTSCSVNGSIFTLGGIKNALEHVGSSDLSLYQIHCTKLPFPIRSNLINNPAMIPNPDLYVMCGDTNHIRKVDVSGDVPPPLLCMTSSEITPRHIFYYGGFQYDDKVVYTDGKFLIKRNVILNNSGYILDTQTLKFKKYELIAHPTILSKHPITVPRFGHSSSSVNLSKPAKTHQRATTRSNPATVFIMGGYRQNNHGEFEIISDLWKVEFSIKYRGKNEYIDFGETILATPIHRAIDDDFLPSPRAFHVAEIFDSNHVFGKFGSSIPASDDNPKKVGVINHSYSPDSLSAKSYTSTRFEDINLKLVIHGGTDGIETLGDVWWFDFDQEVWTEVNTYFPKYDDHFIYKDELFQCQVRKVAHTSLIIDRYLILFGGSIPANFTRDVTDKNGTVDISSLYITMKQNKDELYHRLYILNLSNQTWVLYRCFHNFEPSEGEESKTSLLGNIGATLTSCNSRVFYIGGQLIQNYISREEEKLPFELLNTGISIFEFPLGSFTNASFRNKSIKNIV